MDLATQETGSSASKQSGMHVLASACCLLPLPSAGCTQAKNVTNKETCSIPPQVPSAAEPILGPVRAIFMKRPSWIFTYCSSAPSTGSEPTTS